MSVPELAGVTFHYARNAWDDHANRGTITIVATKGRTTEALEIVADAEVRLFETAFLIDGALDELWIGLVESPRPPNRECSAFDIAQTWQATGLGGERMGPRDYFYRLPDAAVAFELNGMAYVDYRGVRVACGTLSGRIFAERRPTP